MDPVPLHLTNPASSQPHSDCSALQFAFLGGLHPMQCCLPGTACSCRLFFKPVTISPPQEYPAHKGTSLLYTVFGLCLQGVAELIWRRASAGELRPLLNPDCAQYPLTERQARIALCCSRPRDWLDHGVNQSFPQAQSTGLASALFP